MSTTGGGGERASTGIDHGADLMLQTFADVLRVVQRVFFSGKDESGSDQRRTMQGQQFLQHQVLRHAQSKCLALRMAQAARHFLGRFQDCLLYTSDAAVP